MEVDPYDDPSLYEITRTKPMKKFKKICRIFDLYSLPITLRYKQQKKFYTNYGACTSITIIFLMLGFIGSYLIQMFADTQITEAVFTKLIKDKDRDKFLPG